MAVINIDDVYILGETGAEVDKVTGLFTKNENATMGEKEMARLNIAAGGSNDNLLDNAYFVGGGSQLGDGHFPINQRGQTSYSGSTYGIDRWRTWASSTTVSLTASGLTFATGTYSDGLFQYFPQGKIESLYGLTVTASLLLTDGTLYTATGVAAAECWIATEINGGYFGYTNGFLRINLDANKSITIKAVKLEVGTVSTLVNDVPPDFGEELRKCQRYLRYVPLIRSLFTFQSAYTIAVKTLEGIEMEGYPTTATLVQAGTAIQFSNSAWATPTNVAIVAFNYNIPTIQIGLSNALDGVGYILDTVILLSCEL